MSEHSHEHTHTHTHPHDGSHDHDHGHSHDGEHSHEHTHEHAHPHDHEHGHDHEHTHNCKCQHSHNHGEAHTHDHHGHEGDKEKDLEILGLLLDHWASHNQDHAKEYKNWVEKMKASGKADVAKCIEEAIELMSRADTHLMEAKKILIKK